MMRHTKHIFPNRMCLTVSMNVKEPEPVPSSFVASPRMPALPECVWALPLIPKDLKSGDVSLHALWARRHGTKYNGAPYIVQRAGEAVYSAAGKAQLKEQVAYYMNNAQYILKGLQEAGFTVSGGVNAPYIWLKAPNGMTSLGVLRLPSGECQRGGYARIRFRTQRRALFPSDGFRKL